MFTKVRALPAVLQAALSSLGYHCDDIQVHVKERESVFSGGGDGYRSFAVLVNMATGERAERWGSWGGSNAFNPHNSVDTDTTLYELPVNMALIKGHEVGGKPVRCDLTIGPSNIVPWLTSSETDLTDDEKQVLAIFKGYKPVARKEYIGDDRMHLIEGLVSRGYISRNKAGATAITTKGKNACKGVRVRYR